MISTPLRIISLNCRGIANPEYRQRFFYYLHTLDADIICLQETHTPPEDARFWTQSWGGPAIWSYHVGLLLAPRHKIRSFSFSHAQRVLCGDITVRGRSFSVANIYAPADRTVRARFFDSFDSTVFDPMQFAFLAGDWNCCPDPVQDRYPISAHSDHWPKLAPALSSFFDAALQGAQQHYFTFIHSSNNHSARLDHVFASSCISHYTFSTDIVDCPYSDHKAVCLSITPATFSRPLIWRLNTSLLTRNDLRDVTEQIFTTPTPNADTDVVEFWSNPNIRPKRTDR
jgi:exonuclease III